jgi:ketosteroid isomerase-like protein
MTPMLDGPVHEPSRSGAVILAGVASANLEILRSIFARWGHGDYEAIDWADPEIEFVIADGPAPSSSTGVAAMAKAWSDVLSPWEGFTSEAEEYRELDGERVLVLLQNTGRGKGSGMELDQVMTRTANLFHIRGGKVTKLVIYFDRDRALAELDS